MYTARPDATKQFCRVGSGGVNWALVCFVLLVSVLLAQYLT